jgi:hypothetical protein
VEHGRQRPALLLARPFIDDHLHRAVALADRARPSIQDRVAEAVERDTAEVTALDPAYLKAATIALAGASFELAGTAVVAIAAAERNSLNTPVDHCLDPPME